MDRLHEVLPDIIFLFLVVGVPLIAILTHHQRKMALIIHGRDEKGLAMQSEQSLQADIADLRRLVTRQARQIDELQAMQRNLAARAEDSGEVINRLST